VDLTQVARTGPHGRASAADVAAATRAAPACAAGISVAVVEVDLTVLARCRPEAVLAFVAEATARAWTEIIGGAVHLALSVDGSGTGVLVIANAADLTVAGIARRARARSGEQVPATVAVVDDGERGLVLAVPAAVAGIPPRLGLGSVVRRPVAMVGGDGQELLTVRSMAYLSVTHDPDLLSDLSATRCLTRVKARLERWDESTVAEALPG
jgi:hypothetical protein